MTLELDDETQAKLGGVRQPAAPTLPRAYRPVVKLTAEDLRAMQVNIVEWMRDPKKMKLWVLARAMLHLQVRNRIASEVPGGRSGPQATLRAQDDFARSAAELVELIDKLGAQDISAEDAQRLLMSGGGTDDGAGA